MDMRASICSNYFVSRCERLLVFHIGSLGDTLVAVPALHVIRDTFPKAHITMLTDQQAGRNLVGPQVILENSGLVDDFMTYTISHSKSGRWLNYWRRLSLLLQLRRKKFSVLVYLVRTYGNQPRIGRDVFFFRLAGIKRIVGNSGFVTLPDRSTRPLPLVPHIADQFLTRLKFSRLSTPELGQGNTSLNISLTEHARVAQWLSELPSDRGRPWVGFGSGSKMTAKIWPSEHYIELGRRLIETFDIWPVVFGGAEDRAVGEKLIKEWGRGYVAAGELDVRSTIAALAMCRLYIGNDTGTMHMAASADVQCVAIFSARDFLGQWYPYGHGHVIFRKTVDCEGCMLEKCPYNNHCIKSISIDEVFAACRELLACG